MRPELAAYIEQLQQNIAQRNLPASPQALQHLLTQLASDVSIRSAQDLAQHTGPWSALLRDTLADLLSRDDEIRQQWQTWKTLAGWDEAQFADEYAQALTFGLIAARFRHIGEARQGTFTVRDVAWDMLPTAPFVREFFAYAATPESPVIWLLGALAGVLARADIAAIRHELGQRSRLQDPLSPLYRTFIEHYAPQQTHPASVDAQAAYLVSGVQHLVKRRFKYKLGLADEKVRIIDPQAGTGTMLYFVIQQIRSLLRQQQQLGAWDAYVGDALLSRLYGFEDSLAAYTLAHLKIGLQLELSGYRFGSGQRLQIYLSGRQHTDVPVEARFILEEMRLAPAADAPVTVVISTSPDNQHILEAAQTAIGESRGGVVALLLPDDFSHCDELVEMRQSLLHFYSDLYLLQLPEMTLGLFARRFDWTSDIPGRVHHAIADDSWLAQNTFALTTWEDARPQAPDYRFVPVAESAQTPHEAQGWLLSDIMPDSGPGLDADHLAFFSSSGNISVTYRSFDVRYAAQVPGDSLLHQMRLGNNMGLCANAGRIFCTRHVPHADVLGPDTRFYPLYIYPDDAQLFINSPFAPGVGGRRPNLDPKFIVQLANHLDLTFIPDGRGDLKETFGPDDIFYYVYAVLFCRESDFLPLPNTVKSFRNLSRAGRDLVRAHLLHRASNWSFITGFQGSGLNRVNEGYPRFFELAGEPGGRISISKDHYFSAVERDLWETRVGGGQVLRDWLVARQGYVLTWGDLAHYQRMIVALARAKTALDTIRARLAHG